MTIRLVLGYLALCAGLSAYDVRGLSGLWFYALGLLACLLIAPAQQWMTERRAYALEMKRFQDEVRTANRLASQLVGGNF